MIITFINVLEHPNTHTRNDSGRSEQLQQSVCQQHKNNEKNIGEGTLENYKRTLIRFTTGAKNGTFKWETQ